MQACWKVYWQNVECNTSNRLKLNLLILKTYIYVQFRGSRLTQIVIHNLFINCLNNFPNVICRLHVGSTYLARYYSHTLII